MTNNENRIAPGKEQSAKGPALGKALSRLRGLLALCLCFCLTLGLLPTPALAEDSTNDWTDDGNYDISWYSAAQQEFTLTTAEQFAGLAYLVNQESNPVTFEGKTIKLGADIDLTGHQWRPIGNCTVNFDATPVSVTTINGFAGTFDGAGYTIRGLLLDDISFLTGKPEEIHALFRVVGPTGKIQNLTLESASVGFKGGGLIAWASLLVGYLAEGATVFNCSVSGSLDVNLMCGRPQYLAGLVVENNGTIKNSSVHVTGMSGNLASGGDLYLGGIFARGSGTVENCFAVVDSDTTSVGTKYKYALGPNASYSYWAASSVLDNSGVTPSGSESFSVTADQIAGTGNTPIGSGTYANTTSLVNAMNAWVKAENAKGGAKYSKWMVNAQGQPIPFVLPPDYIDITTVPEQTKEGTAGQVNADVKLEGQVQESVELISVTLPASIPFIMDVDAAGALQRVLSATATLTNRSDVGVTVTLTDVVDNDPTPLLDKADFVLVPDPDPTGNPVSLTAGTGKTDVLAILAAPADGVPTTSLLKVDGAAKADVASVGSDGDSFTIGLTLKVNKTT